MCGGKYYVVPIRIHYQSYNVYLLAPVVDVGQIRYLIDVAEISQFIKPQ